MNAARDSTAFGLGVLFAVGLGISGMTQPAKVVGFLDFGGSWDPTLAFVMAGAVATYFVAYRSIISRPGALFGDAFDLPKRREIDAKLVVGASIFGVGWGLSGYCPGPAFTSLGSLTTSAVVVSFGIAGGMLLHRACAGWLRQ